MEILLTQMAIFTVVNFPIIFLMELVFFNGKVKINTLDNLRTVSHTVQDLLSLKTEINILAIIRTISLTELELFNIIMVINM